MVAGHQFTDLWIYFRLAEINSHFSYHANPFQDGRNRHEEACLFVWVHILWINCRLTRISAPQTMFVSTYIVLIHFAFTMENGLTLNEMETFADMNGKWMVAKIEVKEKSHLIELSSSINDAKCEFSWKIHLKSAIISRIRHKIFCFFFCLISLKHMQLNGRIMLTIINVWCSECEWILPTSNTRWLELCLVYNRTSTRNKSICEWDSTIYDEHWQSKQFFDLYMEKSRENIFECLCEFLFLHVLVCKCVDAVILAPIE